LLAFCTLQEWPEEDYPIYANGPGYVISSDIADSILSEFVDHKLRVRLVDRISLVFILFAHKQCPAFYDTKNHPYGELLSTICMSQE
jgi:hypothetical protein